MVKTLYFHCTGHGLIRGQETKILNATCWGQKEKNAITVCAESDLTSLTLEKVRIVSCLVVSDPLPPYGL